MSRYTAELATFYDSAESALSLMKGRIWPVECPEAEKKVGMAGNFRLATKKAQGGLFIVLACTVDMDESVMQELHELHQEGCQLYVGQHLVVGPI